MVNTPIPSSVKSEAKKAAKILQDFTFPSAKTGPDKIIPVSLILKAKGLAILSVFKLGFLVTARGGSGIVIAKLNDGSWSPPSAIGLAGLGGGFEIGAEVTDFVIILNTQSAVDAFSKGGNLTLGGNFTVAAGPLGRNVEADVSVKSPAAIYSYSKTKGLFAGISIEGSGLIERKDANKKFYGEDVRAFQILQGLVDRPPGCDPLYNVLEKQAEIAAGIVADKVKKKAEETARKSSESGFLSRFDFKNASFGGSKKRKSSTHSLRDRSPPTPDERRRPSYDVDRVVTKPANTRGRSLGTNSSGKSFSVYDTRGAKPKIKSTQSFKRPAPKSHIDPWASAKQKINKVRALHNYTADLPCDLSFNSGDVIVVLTMTEKQDDWWEGEVHGKRGIFPANFTMVIK
ncbi:SH3 domain-containing YSC84-like protein 1 [Lineus longissimus]|uniref:SH3 domain-containing YSC84-like protein 1 n=1 Tax=Lineus longissimus TaxID=88925 RepID=UPI002B4D7B92